MLKTYGLKIGKVKTKFGDLLLLNPHEAPLYKWMQSMQASSGPGPDFEWIEDELHPEGWYDKDDLDSILGLKKW